MRLRPIWIAARNILGLLAMLGLGMGPALVAAQEPNQAGLVVQFGDGRLETRCISFEGDQIGGDELLAQSGLDVLLDPSSGMGVTVCRIEGQGCDYPAQDCFCRCMGGSGCAYWNYFYREPGAGPWTYSALGALLRKVKPGAVEAWVWGDGHSPPDDDLTFEAVCAAPSPAPTAEPEITVETAATAPATPGPVTATLQPTTAPLQSQAPAPGARTVTSTATPAPTRAPVQASRAGPADYWPFGLMVLALVAVGVLVWLRQGRV